jgi:hypothetical protein
MKPCFFGAFCIKAKSAERILTRGRGERIAFSPLPIIIGPPGISSKEEIMFSWLVKQQKGVIFQFQCLV